jgi:predicted nuclease of predicted toxin-antitoxin system
VRLKLDENLPADAAEPLRALGHDVETVVGEGLAGSPDGEVVSAAGREGRMLMTLDRGMADIRAYPPGSHPGIVVFRLDDQAAPALVATFESFATNHDLHDLAGCVTIVRGHLVRIRRPS